MVLIIRWAFRMYDKDNSGEIDLDEMVEIFCLMYAIQVKVIVVVIMTLIIILYNRGSLRRRRLNVLEKCLRLLTRIMTEASLRMNLSR